MKMMLDRKVLTHGLSLTIATLGLSTGNVYAQKFSTPRLSEPVRTLETAISPKITRPIAVVQAPVFDQRDIRDVEMFSLLEDTADSFNAATFVTVERNRRNAEIDEFTAVLDGVKTVFNDLGREADIEAGDGVFSAFIRFDENQQLRD